MEKTLHDNSAILLTFFGPQNNSSSEVKKLRLDTRETCFACLKDNLTVIKSDDNNLTICGMTEVCLRNISRYLNIDPSYILLRCLQNRELNQEEIELAASQKDKIDFIVLLCSSCAAVSSKLSDLIDQLERTKMMVNHQIKEFQETINESLDNVDDQWNRLQEKLSQGSSNPVKVQLVEQLRKETTEKCAARTRRSQKNCIPKVQLKPLDPTGNENRNPPVIHSPNRVNSAGPINQFFQGISGSRRPLSIESKLVSKVFSNHCQKISNNLTNTYRCLVCADQSKSKPYQKNVILRHMVNIHPEVFFAHKRSPNMSEKRFRFYCKRILIETSNYKTVRSSPGQNDLKKTGILCAICGARYRDHRQDLRYHLVINHYEILEEKLSKKLDQGKFCEKNYEKVMETNWDNSEENMSPINSDSDCSSNSGSSEISSHIPPYDHSEDDEDNTNSDAESEKSIESTEESHFKILYKVDNNRYKCLHCKYTCSKDPFEISKHLLHIHPEKVLKSAKLGKLSKVEFKECCKCFLKSETKKGQEEAALRGLDKIKLTEKMKKESPFVCHICEKIYIQGDVFRYHLISKHFGEIKESLVEIQVKPLVKVKEKANLDMSAMNSDKKSMEAFKIISNFKDNYKLVNGCYQCLHCSCSNVKKKAKITQHLIIRHPEKVLISLKDFKLSEGEFLKCCKTALGSETRKSQEEAVEMGVEQSSKKHCIPLGCRICKQVYKYGQDFRHHLVVKHFSYFEKILIKAQMEFVHEREQVVNDEQNSNMMMEEDEDENYQEDEDDMIIPEDVKVDVDGGVDPLENV